MRGRKFRQAEERVPLPLPQESERALLRAQAQARPLEPLRARRRARPRVCRLERSSES